jgi:hypothetical protein
MVGECRRGVRNCLFLGLLFFSISGYGSHALTSPPTLEIQSAFPFDFAESSWMLADLDGDQTPDFVTGRRLGRTTDGYFYRVELQLSSDRSSSSFTVFHNYALGLRITGVDIDGDNDTDLIISDRFFRKYIGIWLNDGKGHFVKSLPGRFSPNSVSDLAFVAVDLNCSGQPTVYKQHRRLPDCLPTSGYIRSLARKSSSSDENTVERIFGCTVVALYQRPPPAHLVA